MNDAFYEILKEFYSVEEAEVIVRMPYVSSGLDRISKITKIDKTKLQHILEGLSAKGLVMDIWLRGEYKYMLSPLFVGVFEFTMMRTGDGLNMKKWGNLFNNYMHDGAPFRANFNGGEQTSIARALPHEEAVGDHVEILDYERATSIIEEAEKFSVGNCSCRHKKLHAEGKECFVPLSTCTSFGIGAEYLIRHKMAKEVSKSEMLEIFARSKELGLVFSADNVQKRLMFICHCCGCCCQILNGITTHGLPATLVTSTLIPEIDEEKCIGCKKCSKACHINAIEMIPIKNPSVDAKGKKKKKFKPLVDQSICVGCGVCALDCKTGALKLVKREKNVIHPETTFHRVILQSLDRGTLQNQIFDNPGSMTQTVMRGIVGGFFKLFLVKKALMSDALRSTFLKTMATGVKVQGKGYILEL
ncbi:MAG: 4Fe-4S dicluster domain-containing protein [Desulfobacteraceae bacterium]|nr:4Fe-4S dicluster domain-containing protein [Desulfobacteraceae bacterium]MBC2756353.1 4Fe-4S dicluster domain-containing protein [Desulfobacteraceae bacterium]